ncbi:hypothetical protein [Neobacillus vireti]|uniref:Uncharacterized protein n=1 Tax=Neobacillus vireti LMG 21834 TaxID=1131730 RepID=A0AB94IR33_9BACI|nr:hypothetical protein [Neobacillus vireti]ETI69408.1 hypothetical protein BAVI_07496 [Neobacillus vireti LMG 21834]KLT18890.1 hypothetical protein AA980_05990 [Neobacillus vireti]
MIFEILFFVIFMIASFHFYRKYILIGHGWNSLIGANSFIAGFGIIKDNIPDEKKWFFHIVTVIIGLSILALVEILRRKHKNKVIR